MAEDFRSTAQRVLGDLREVDTVVTIEIVVSRYERERRVAVVSYDDYLAAMRRPPVHGMMAPVDRHWYERWRLVRREVEMERR